MLLFVEMYSNFLVSAHCQRVTAVSSNGKTNSITPKYSMILVVDLFDPMAGRYSYLDAIQNDVAGDESCRKTLWGSQSLTDRHAKYFPQLVADDLHVYPCDLDAFAEECQMVNEEAATIALEIYKDEGKARDIEAYVARVVFAIQAARDLKAGVCIS